MNMLNYYRLRKVAGLIDGSIRDGVQDPSGTSFGGRMARIGGAVAGGAGMSELVAAGLRNTVGGRKLVKNLTTAATSPVSNLRRFGSRAGLIGLAVAPIALGAYAGHKLVGNAQKASQNQK